THRFEGHASSVTHVAFLPDGKSVLSIAPHRPASIFIWDAATGKEVRRIGASARQDALAVTSSQDGRLLLLGNNEIAQLWDVEADKEVRQFKGHDLFVTHVAFSRDTRFALTVAKKREGDKDTFRMHLWDVAIGRELRRFPRHHTDIGRICFTPDG